MRNRRFLAFTPKDSAFTVTEVGPHTPATRISYTVPDGKVAVLEGASLGVWRSTAPTVAGFARVYLMLTRAGGTSIILAQAGVTGLSPDARDSLVFSVPFTLRGGDVLTLKTWDNSTGDTAHYAGAVIISEY